MSEPRQYDALDQQLLRALGVDGRAPFSRIAAVLGVSDQTIARRYRRLRADGEMRVVGVRDIQRLGMDAWMLRLRCAPDAAEPIARSLARRGDTAWIGLTSGGTEVVCGTRPRSLSERDELLLGKLPRTPSIMDIQAHQILHRFYGGPVDLTGKDSVLTAAQTEALRPRRSGHPGPARITPEDEPLIAALEADGRATLPELQRATGGTESSVRRRLTRLLESGAVFLDVQFDFTRFGYRTPAMLWITAAPGELGSVGRALAAHPEVVFCAAVGGHCNLTAVVACRGSESVYRYLDEKLGRLPGIRHVECTPVLRQIKQLVYEERQRR